MKHTAKKWLALLLAAMLLLSLVACAGSGDKNDGADNSQTSDQTQDSAQTDTAADTQQSEEEDYNGKLISEGMMELEYAANFSVEYFKGGYRLITAGSHDTKILLVPEEMSVPEGLEDDVWVAQMPVERVYMASTGATSLIDAIGALDRVKLVSTEIDGWYVDNVIAEMESGNITYSGNFKEPDFEIMTANDIQLHVDTTMVDSYPEVLDKFAELGIPSIVDNSSKENSCLGRVEWVKLYGVLFGKEAEAEAFFDEQKELIKNATAPESLGKTVAMGYISSTSEKCYARNGGDYMVEMIHLAGGDYILADMNPDKGATTSMTFEEWYACFKEAEYMFFVGYGVDFYSLQEMIDFDPLFADFRSVQENKVWITSPDFSQSTAAIASIVDDMHTILSSEDPTEVTTDHLIKIK